MARCSVKDLEGKLKRLNMSTCRKYVLHGEAGRWQVRTESKESGPEDISYLGTCNEIDYTLRGMLQLAEFEERCRKGET